MATQAEVLELDGQGLSISEIAERLEITPNGVYGHLARAGKPRRGSKARRKRQNIIAKTEQLPTPVQENGSVLEHIRVELGDAVENLESNLALKRAEVEAMEHDHGVLYQAYRELSSIHH